MVIYSKMAEDASVTVKKILSDSNNVQTKYKSIDVFKEVEPIVDLGNLLLNDQQPIDLKGFKNGKETFLHSLARDNTQLLFAKLWELPIERIENVVVAKLPVPNFILPREKAVPKPKQPTKWEDYAKKKGIEKKKRTRMIWDEEAKNWKPRYGYKRANDETNQWCMEVPDNKDPYEDQFEKVLKEKKERVAKNELQRLRNIARNQKTKSGTILSSQFKPSQTKEKDRVIREIDVAKVSTASMGKFQERLPKEKENKKSGMKRKFESVSGDISKEKENALQIWQKLNKVDTLDTTKAVNKHIATEQMSAQRKKSGKVKNKRFKKGKQSTMDRMKGRTLGKTKKKK